MTKDDALEADMIVEKKTRRFQSETFWRGLVTACGLLIILLTMAIGIFLLVKGTGTFTKYHHSVAEFLFSSEWKPMDSANEGGGNVGAAIYIYGSLLTCSLALAIALPFSIAAAIFMAEISPKLGQRLIQPAVEIFVGIPSVVYGWIGLTVLVPFIRDHFGAKMGGFSVLAASIVLSVMIFPTITTVASDAIRSVPKEYRSAAYGMGSTRWQAIYRVIVPAAFPGIFTGIILGLARAFGEALAVAMVIGKTRAFPADLLSPTNNLTAAIAADMGNSADGGEHNLALWTMALLLFLISMGFIYLIHHLSRKGQAKHGA
ncbi:MAG: phosphate transport system permease protein [Clostridiales bacterium]|jgi:phosphate transport system permease protein|nr:phosphate transport system permease protein [Clostridiales bacterium]MDN5299771.1 phosphate transport system permease protein [Clostridiales bacterium]